MAAVQENHLQGIAQLLVQEKLLDKENALHYQQLAATSKLTLLHYLVSNHIIAAHMIALSVSKNFGIPMIDLDCIDLQSIPTTLVNEKLIRRHSIVPLFNRGTQLYVATDDPSKQGPLKEIQFHTGLHTTPIVVEADKLIALIDKLLHEKESQGLAEYFEDNNSESLEFNAEEEEKEVDTTITNEDAPVVKFINRILIEAIKKGASDIHFEPFEREYRIRYRQDGMLHEVASPPVSLSSRIKVMSSLDISERRVPQDGRFKMKLSRTRSIDFRVSTCPTVAGEAEEEEKEVDTTITNEDAPVVKFINRILIEAIKKGASDIHFEPFEREYRIRYRQDGMLHEVASPPVSLSSRIAARIKVMSSLDISERRVPQDGRFKMKLSRTRSIDFRVSTCPTVAGEKVVMRILDPGSTKLGIESLGFSPHQHKLFLHAISRPQGMILVTGPTGSGKTVTLYTALNILNTIEKNISTAEDPVEIKVSGINQVNINPKAGLTFSGTLRSFLRQDPDIIMVGEVRDLETAEIAVKAAQTGHLVLSTLHTNSSAETLTRLVNMGIPSFNIASSVSLIIAQRLVRRLCEYCKVVREDVTAKSLVELGFTEQIADTLITYQAIGCNQCTNGYRGRIGLFEAMPMTKTLGRLMMSGGNSLDILKLAQEEGMLTVYQAGLEKIKAGVTTIEEVNRVTVD